MHNCKGNQRLNLPADEQRIAARMVGQQLLLITLASPATSCSSRGTPPGALGRVLPAPGRRMDPPLERLPASTNPLPADPAAEPRRPRLHRPRYGLLPSVCARGSATAATQSTGSLRNAIERLTSTLQNIQPFVYPSETPHRFFDQDVLVRVRAVVRVDETGVQRPLPRRISSSSSSSSTPFGVLNAETLSEEVCASSGKDTLSEAAKSVTRQCSLGSAQVQRRSRF